MAKSSGDRGKASRLRNLKRELTPTEKAWLAKFDATAQPTGRRAALLRSSAPPATTTSSTPATSTTSSSAPPATTPATPERVFVDVDVDEPEDDDQEDDDEDDEEPSSSTTSPASSSSSAIAPVNSDDICTVPNCTACRAHKPRPFCKATKRPIYEELEEDSAEMFASFIFGITLGGVAAFRALTGDKRRVPRPKDEERKRLGSNIQKVARRRFPELGAADDILGTLAGVMTYGTRAALGDGGPPRAPASSSSTPAALPREAPPAAPAPRAEPRPTLAPRPSSPPAALETEGENDEDLSDEAIDRELERRGIPRGGTRASA